MIKTEGDLWWYEDGSSPMGKDHLADNKIYSLNYNYGGCFNRLVKYYDATTDTINDGITTNGDIAIARKVYKSGTTISTPAGNFDDCIVFDIEFSIAYETLKPGIGFVKFAYDDYNGGGYREYTLIDYYLE